MKGVKMKKNATPALDRLLLKYDVDKSLEGLKKIHILYEENFIGIVGNKEKYKIERELEKLCLWLQKDLGVHVYNPCPLSGSINCWECTGYYGKSVNSKGKKICVMVEGGEKCKLFAYSKNGYKHGLLL